MLRRTLAALILGPSLLLASLAWAGFTALRTVLDPDRSEQIATDLYDDPEVRNQLTANLSSALSSVLPDDVSASGAQLNAAADRVLEDDAVRSLVIGTFAETHRGLLGESDVSQTLDIGSVGSAVRSSLVGIRPDLDQLLPASPVVVVDLPTDRIPDLSPVRSFLTRAVPILAMVAAAGVVLALFTTSTRDRVLRRAGWWAVTASAMVLVVGFFVPFVARRALPDQAEVLGAILTALLASLIQPSIVLGVLGAGLIISGFALRGKQRLAAARPEDPVEPNDHGRVTGRIDVGARGPRKPQPTDFPNWAPQSEPLVSTGAPVQSGPAVQAVPVVSVGQTVPSSPAGPSGAILSSGAAMLPHGTTYIDPQATSPIEMPRATPPPEQPTALIELDPQRTQLMGATNMPDLYPARQPAAKQASASNPGPPPPKWREGIGWVQHPEDHREHAGSRWEPGIGYILDGQPSDDS